MKSFRITIFLLCFVIFAKAQTFERNYLVNDLNLYNVRDFEYNTVNGGVILGMVYASPPANNLIRINNIGDTLWTKKLSLDSIGINPFYPEATAPLSNGNYLVGGYARDVLYGSPSCFVFQMTPSGNTVSSFKIPTNVLESGLMLESSSQSNSYFMKYNLDLLATNTQIKIQKRLNDNSILWEKFYSSIGQYFNIGLMKGTSDDGVVFNYSTNSNINYLTKLDANGNQSWQVNLNNYYNLGNSTSYGPTDLICTNDSFIIVTGGKSDTTINHIRTEHLLKFNLSGGLIDSASFYNLMLYNVAETSNGKLLFSYCSTTAAGITFFDKNFNPISTYPFPFSETLCNWPKIIPNSLGGGFVSFFNSNGYTPGHYYAANFDSTLATYPVKINGNVSLDNNQNCIFDSGDFLIKNATIELDESSGQKYYAFPNFNTGLYNACIPYGNYNVTHHIQSANKAIECPVTGYNYNISTSGAISGVNFYDTLIPNLKDLKVLIYPERFVPGFTSSLYVECDNVGTVTANTSLRIVKDPALQFVSSTPTPSSILGDTLIYSINSLLADSSFLVNIKLKTDSLTSIGATVKIIAKADWLGDLTPYNNTDTLNSVVVGSYDPNVKTVNRPMYFNGSDEMLYRVQFQNTGTSYAQNVVVVDSIDNNLDMSTFKLVSVSHPNINILYSANNKLSFRFDNIHLLDSNTNQSASHGEFIYSIKPKFGLTPGTIIRNRAYIYFDYNNAIITNTTKNIIASYSGVGVSGHINKTGEVSIYPNPTNSIFYLSLPKGTKNYLVEIYDFTGNKVLNDKFISSNANQAISVDNLQAGIYFVKTSYSGISETRKLVLIK